jgi:acetyl esterase/lipase
MKRLRLPIQGLFLLLILEVFGGAMAQETNTEAAPESSRKNVGITFAEIDGIELKLDLYLPDNVEKPGLVVSIHGGAWRRFSRGDRAVSRSWEHHPAVIWQHWLE